MYYKITHKDNETREHVFSGQQAVGIGQTVSADVRLPLSERYEPQMFATIIPAEGGEGWVLVRSTDSYSVNVNGEGCAVVQRLRDGDVLSFGEIQCSRGGESQETILVFHECKGEYGESAVDSVRRSFLKLYIAAAALLLMVMVPVVWLLVNADRRIDISEYESSIYRITVDSVFLVRETEVNGVIHRERIAAMDLNNAEGQYQGTAFLTQDSLLVTARHCIEPWLGYEIWDGTVKEDQLPDDVRYAIEAETHNMGEQGSLLRQAQEPVSKGSRRFQKVSGGILKVCSHCILENATDTMRVYSTDFCMDKSRDHILCLGTDVKPMYWRSIYPMCNNWLPELGDFAYMRCHKAGTLSLADIDDLKTFNEEERRPVTAVGYPVHNAKQSSQHAITSEGKAEVMDIVGQDFKEDICINEIVINPGNSGGPVLARIGHEVKVIGIVSKADTKATQGVDYAVPVTEVLMLKKKGGKTDETIYRR